MAREADDLWQALLRSGENVGSEEDYEHGYAREVRGDLQQHVTFVVAGETYGLPIGQIAEISKALETTPVPRTTDFLLGLGNVRGHVLPVIDLARRLRLRSEPTDDRFARVLIVRLDEELYGLLVDRVLRVTPIAPEDLEDTPGGLTGQRADFIRALARSDDTLIIILDLAEILRPSDFIAAKFRGATEGS